MAQPHSLMGWVCAVGCVFLLQEAGAGHLDAGTSQHVLLPGLVCAPTQSGLEQRSSSPAARNNGVTDPFLPLGLSFPIMNQEGRL